MLALKYYLDQITQVCIENTLQQPPLRMPKPCHPIALNTLGEAEEIAHITLGRSGKNMDRVGVNSAERSSIEQPALRHNQRQNMLCFSSLPRKIHWPIMYQFQEAAENAQTVR